MSSADPPNHRTDDLTRLPLRSGFLEAAVASMESARALGQPLSLLVLDVDHFKLINDTYGHLQGDDVLREVADLLRHNLRGYDIAARYAGDEFVALLPDTPLEGARILAERICAAARGHGFRMREGAGHAGSATNSTRATIPVTLSIGVATCPEHGVTTETLFAAADRALYQVKRQGRDGAAAASDGGTGAHVPLAIDRFVGRTEELRTLVRLLEDATAGRPRVVAVSGEAGIGKSTLVKQLEPEVRLRAGTLVIGRCHEADVQPPYAPWAEVLGSLRRRGDPDPTRTWRALPQLVPAIGGTPDGAVADVRAGIGGSKYLLLEEISAYVRLVAKDRPLVVVLDDMQWADSASWDALEHFVAQLVDERVLICLTMRAEETRGEALERRRRLSRNEAFHAISLARLSREELRQWLAAAFHRPDVGRELLAFLYRHTEGNPLFVVQVLRTLLDEGAVWHSGDQWEWKPVSELRLPVAVGDLISRRLSRLSPSAHGVLTAASVIGREFDIDLAIDAGAGTEDELLDAIDEGVRAGVVQVTTERRGDRFSFTHVLLAEVLRDSVNPRRLRRLHARVAEALGRRAPGAVAEIATHYDRAGDQAGAYRYALLAADGARNVYAHLEGGEFLRVAERNAANASELAHVRARLAEVMEATGRYEDAEELCDLAIEWYAGQHEAPRALALRFARERVRARLNQPARQTLDACLALDDEARALEIGPERVALLRTISQMHGTLGDRAAAERVAWTCVRLAEELADDALHAASLTRLAVTLDRERPAQAVEIFQRALELFRSVGDSAGQGVCHNGLGIAHTNAGDWAGAEEELTTAIALARVAGATDACGLYSMNLGVVHLRCGDYERARDLFGEALAIFAAVKSGERQLYALYNLAHLDHERGETESAAELFEIAAALAKQVGHADVEIGAVAGAGLARLAQGDVAAATRAEQVASERLMARGDWFQGRELVEALRVRLHAEQGASVAVVVGFETARALADASDFYSAAWLTANCAPVLLAHDAAIAREAVERYAERVRELGYQGIQRRYESLGFPG